MDEIISAIKKLEIDDMRKIVREVDCFIRERELKKREQEEELMENNLFERWIENISAQLNSGVENVDVIDAYFAIPLNERWFRRYQNLDYGDETYCQHDDCYYKMHPERYDGEYYALILDVDINYCDLCRATDKEYECAENCQIRSIYDDQICEKFAGQDIWIRSAAENCCVCSTKKNIYVNPLTFDVRCEKCRT